MAPPAYNYPYRSMMPPAVPQHAGFVQLSQAIYSNQAAGPAQVAQVQAQVRAQTRAQAQARAEAHARAHAQMQMIQARASQDSALTAPTAYDAPQDVAGYNMSPS